MLSEIELKTLNWIYSAIASKFLGMPLDWKDGKLLLKTNPVGQVYNKIICAILLSVSIFRLKQLPGLIGKGYINASILQIVFVARYLFHFIYRLNTWTFKMELVQVVNQSLYIHSVWGRTLQLGELKASKVRGWIFFYFFLSLILGLVMLTLVIIATRNEEYSVYHYIQVDSSYNPKMSLLIFAAFVASEAFMTIDFGLNAFPIFASFYLSCSTMNFCLHQLCIDWTTPEYENGQYNLETRIIHYRGVDILNKNFNMAFGSLILPSMKLWMAISWGISFFALVRYWSDMESLSLAVIMFITVGSPVILIIISSIMSSMYQDSVQFQMYMLPKISQLEDVERRKNLTRQLKACSLIRCQVGGMYHMEAKAKLTLFQHVVNGIVFLLVNV